MSNNFKRKGCDSESGSLTGTLAQSFSGKGIKEASRFLEESLQTPVSPAHQWPSAASDHCILSGEADELTLPKTEMNDRL